MKFTMMMMMMVVMGNSKNLRLFNFAILLKWRKFDAREIYMFYST